MPRKIWIVFSVLLVAVLGTSPVQAKDSEPKGITLTPGLWLIDIEIQAPMQPKPTRQRTQTCVTDELFTVDSLMPWVKDQGCKIRGVKAVENKLTWTLRCRREGQRSKGRGEFTVNGDHGEGKAKINFEVAGKRMSLVSKWDANRVGECSAEE